MFGVQRRHSLLPTSLDIILGRICKKKTFLNHWCVNKGSDMRVWSVTPLTFPVDYDRLTSQPTKRRTWWFIGKLIWPCEKQQYSVLGIEMFYILPYLDLIFCTIAELIFYKPISDATNINVNKQSTVICWIIYYS